MNPARRAPWRRLVPLTVFVLAVHGALLAPAHRPPRPAAAQPVHFAMRSVPAPVAAAPAPPAAPVPVPQPIQPAAALAAAPRRERPSTARDAPPAMAGTAPQARAPASPPLPRVLAPPPSARLHYEVTTEGRGATRAGEATLDWRQDGRQYEAALQVTRPGLPTRSQRSTGAIADSGLVPACFAEKTRGEQATHFDRAHGRIVFSNNRPQAPLAPGMQDRLSAIVQLAMLVGAEPARFPAGAQIALPTAGTREADTWIFRVEGEEDLHLPGGELRALKLQRLPRREFDQKLELWLAPRMDYAPVRLRLTNPDGGTADHRWSSTDRG